MLPDQKRLFLKVLGRAQEIGSAKTDPVRFNGASEKGLLKDKSTFFEAYKSPEPKRRKLLKQKGPC